MESKKAAQLSNKNIDKINNNNNNNNNRSDNKKIYVFKPSNKKSAYKDYKMYTPDIVIKYKNSLKELLKLTKNKTKTKFILYKRVCEWYRNEESMNLSMERIYIKTKLGSYTSGGCGIGASLFAGLTASGVFSYMDNYIKKLGPLFLGIYAVLVLCFGVKILSNEDNKVEMYNMFLQVLNDLENDKIDK